MCAEARSAPSRQTRLAPVLEGRDLKLLIEPGRAIVARAGALVARVLYRKHRSAGRVLVLRALGLRS